jgi:hypothetical protein
MAVGAFIGCGPARIPPIDEIEPHETAFLVPLEGSSEEGQAKFMSVEYLEQAKVAAKRVTHAVRKRKTGRAAWSYEWLPTTRLIVVDRTPVTREWTSTEKTGTTARNEAITVESLESIEFSVGVNITTMVTEADAAKFLYFYTGKSLAEVTDENVRGFIQSSLSAEFGQLGLEGGRKAKKAIFDSTRVHATEHFKEFGITIANMGLAEGLTYKDHNIQAAINLVFEKDMDAQAAINEREAQKTRNKITVEMATAKREAAQQFAMAQEAQMKMIGLEIDRIYAEAALEAAKKWQGELPANIMPEGGSNFLFNVPSERMSSRR